MREPLQNWAGTYTYQAPNLYRPTSIDELQDLVAKRQSVRALGSRHSFNDVADSPDTLIEMTGLDRILSLDIERRQDTVEGGMLYGPLSRYLEAHGFALPKLASLPHISVVGACATATHGSGVKNQSLASAVSRLEFVGPDGQLIGFERGDANFYGAVVHLGALGPVARVTLDLVPSFPVRQFVYEDMPMDALDDAFETIIADGYSVSLFTNWKNDTINQVWRKLTDLDSEVSSRYFGAPAATSARSPILDGEPSYCTEQGGVPGPWHERLPHFRMDFTPSSGDEMQTEFFVARKDAVGAIHAVRSIRDEIWPWLHITEIRTIAADELWLSPFYQRDTVALHFTWRKNWDEVSRAIPKIEAVLAPFAPRAHWGKLFRLSTEQITAAYPRHADFIRLANEIDPNGKFRNAYLVQHLGLL